MMKSLLSVKLSPELLPMLLLVMKHLQNTHLLQIMLIMRLLLLTMLKRLTTGMRLPLLLQPPSPRLHQTMSNTMMLVLSVCTERKQQQLQLTVICLLLRAGEVVEDAGKDADKEGVVEDETREDLPKEEDSSEARLLTAGPGKYDLCETYNLKDPN
jgi:hypothetical protein